MDTTVRTVREAKANRFAEDWGSLNRLASRQTGNDALTLLFLEKNGPGS